MLNNVLSTSKIKGVLNFTFQRKAAQKTVKEISRAEKINAILRYYKDMPYIK